MERPIIDSGQLPIVEGDLAAGTNESAPPLRISPWLIIVPVIAIGALVVWGAWPRIMQRESLLTQKKEQLLQAQSVSYVVAAPAPPILEFVIPGATQAILDTPIYARVDGYIRQGYANLGDRVHAGQVLAEIDTPELDNQVQTAASNVEQAKASLENAKQALDKAQHDKTTASANLRKTKADLTLAVAEYNRYKLLALQGAVSLEELDTRLSNYNGGIATVQAALGSEQSALAAVKSATAAVRASEASLHSMQSQYDQICSTRAFKRVTAKFDGVVTKRNVDQGALVSSGSNSSNTVLYQVANVDVLRVFAYVPEQYVSAVHLGATTGLSFQAFPGQKFTGKVIYVAGGIDPDSRTLQVEIHVPNQDHKLLPGMYAQIKFQEPSTSNIGIIPASAVETTAGGAFVYVIDQNNRLRRTPIQIAVDLGGRIAVDKGVRPGDKVVVSISDDILDGALVNPVLLPLPKEEQPRAQNYARAKA